MIELYLITGFLGAGKTTFLKEVIRQNPTRKFGIIMNEFGKTGIDGKLVRDDAHELIEINRGSIFCDCLKLSFIESLRDMAQKPVEVVFVEGSGLADPSNIGEILDAASLLVGDIYRYQGAVCLVDAAHFSEQQVDLASIGRQIEFSHLAVMNKADLVGEDLLTAVETRLRSINPNMGIEKARYGQLPFNLLEVDFLEGQTIKSESSSNKVDNKPFTVTLTYQGDADREQLKVFLSAMAEEAWRAKGFVRLSDGLYKVDLVSGRIDMQRVSEEHAVELVFLSKVGNRIVRTLVETWEKTMGKLEMKLRN